MSKRQSYIDCRFFVARGTIEAMRIMGDKRILWASISTGAVFGVSLITIIARSGKLPENLVIGFNSISGITAFGNPNEIWGIWITGIVFSIINLILAEVLTGQSKPLSYALVGINIIISILTLTAIGTIVSVN